MNPYEPQSDSPNVEQPIQCEFTEQCTCKDRQNCYRCQDPHLNTAWNGVCKCVRRGQCLCENEESSFNDYREKLSKDINDWKEDAFFLGNKDEFKNFVRNILIEVEHLKKTVEIPTFESEMQNSIISTVARFKKINRFEVIDDEGRQIVQYCESPIEDITWELQDNQKTLKIFIKGKFKETNNDK